jgi:hypothetical protein
VHFPWRRCISFKQAHIIFLYLQAKCIVIVFMYVSSKFMPLGIEQRTLWALFSLSFSFFDLVTFLPSCPEILQITFAVNKFFVAEQLYTQPCVCVCLSDDCLMSVPRFVCAPNMHISPQLQLDIRACFDKAKMTPTLENSSCYWTQ